MARKELGDSFKAEVVGDSIKAEVFLTSAFYTITAPKKLRACFAVPLSGVKSDTAFFSADCLNRTALLHQRKVVRALYLKLDKSSQEKEQ